MVPQSVFHLYAPQPPKNQDKPFCSDEIGWTCNQIGLEDQEFLLSRPKRSERGYDVVRNVI